jgi:hypothetical protein
MVLELGDLNTAIVLETPIIRSDFADIVEALIIALPIAAPIILWWVFRGRKGEKTFFDLDDRDSGYRGQSGSRIKRKMD